MILMKKSPVQPKEPILYKVDHLPKQLLLKQQPKTQVRLRLRKEASLQEEMRTVLRLPSQERRKLLRLRQRQHLESLSSSNQHQCSASNKSKGQQLQRQSAQMLRVKKKKS